MKAIFAHDHCFKLDEHQNFYSNGKITKAMFEIYLDYFDTIKVVARCDSELVDYDSEKLINNDYISFSPFKNLSNPKELLKFSYNKELMKEIIKGFDLVISRLPSEIGLLAISAAKDLGIPYAIEFVACPWDGLWNYGSLQGRIYAPLYYFRNRSATMGADYVTYVTSSFLQKRYPTKGFNSGVSDVILSNTGSSEIKTLDKVDPIHLALIGSLSSPHKGIDTAIESTKLLNESGIHYILNILGPGSSSEWQQKYPETESYVNFCGSLSSGEEVLNWLSNQDIYIQPSLQEGLPRAMIEAMSVSLPIIGTAVGGIPELVHENFLVSKNDSKALSRKIIMLSNKKVYAEESKRSLEESKNYNFEMLNTRRKEFWDKVYNDISTN
ncbi:glycosyltransferase [Vibrio algivorus]|uniref:Glycosyl transferase n=1 Tax=Vibrio algivorus TaxID=1667024 RepID=A0ABQ6EJL0_9VIBR|nr:glycosyltransferase [Vibrio algivorus]GLT13179.1 glycosyl transferase [Vibrio algivorus]